MMCPNTKAAREKPTMKADWRRPRKRSGESVPSD
jgi:hypothetical protein